MSDSAYFLASPACVLCAQGIVEPREHLRDPLPGAHEALLCGGVILALHGRARFLHVVVGGVARVGDSAMFADAVSLATLPPN